MRHPKDGPDRTWVPQDGLLTLIRYAQLAPVPRGLVARGGRVDHLWVAGLRAERAPRRQLYADALAATVAYREAGASG